MRGLVFGHYAECSRDVHTLISDAADAMAAKEWRALGARQQSEARSFFITKLRRSVGITVAREMARHRLRRRRFLGVTREAVQARVGQMQHDQPRQDGLHADDFAAFQQFRQVVDAVAVA